MISDELDRSVTGFGSYLRTGKALWFWLINASTIILLSTVYLLPNSLLFIKIIRYIITPIYILFLPGLSILRILYPTKELDWMQIAAYSIGISASLIPLIGFILNSTPQGLTLTPITLSIVSFTSLFAFVGVYREYVAYR